MAEIVNRLGKIAGWNSITFRAFGRDVIGIKKVAYDNEYGAGGFPVGETEGNYQAKAGIDLLNEEYIALADSIPKGKRIQDITGDIVVEYQYEGRKIKDVIHNVRFKNNGVDVKQGDGSIVRSFNLKTSHITWNA